MLVGFVSTCVVAGCGSQFLGAPMNIDVSFRQGDLPAAEPDGVTDRVYEAVSSAACYEKRAANYQVIWVIAATVFWLRIVDTL